MAGLLDKKSTNWRDKEATDLLDKKSLVANISTNPIPIQERNLSTHFSLQFG